MELIYIRTYIGGVISGQINFKNPFNEKIIISLELKCEEYPDTFKLIGKKININ